MKTTATHTMSRAARICLLLIGANLTGCAALTNPLANGVPVRLVPQELLAQPKEDFTTIALSSLRQEPPEVYCLAPGDLLGVYVEGVLGGEEQLPPVNLPSTPGLPPSVGYPIPVSEDGTLPLPLVKAVPVEGLTLAQAEQAIEDAYTEPRRLLLEGGLILVTLMHPRQTRVLVIRQDSPEGGLDVRASAARGIRGGNLIATGRRRGTGSVVELPAYENDVLTALAKTGGLPGTDAVNEVVIERGSSSRRRRSLAGELANVPPEYRPDPSATNVVRIPLRLPPGQTPSFTLEDILLYDGDIVFIEARDAELFYTGGLLPSLELPLPRDYDLDVVEAMARVGGPILNGGVNSNNLSGDIVARGIGNPSPSLLTVVRRTPNGGQVPIRVDLNRALRDQRENILVQAGDILILQETPSQALARYAKDVFNFSLISDVISRTDTTGTTSVLVP